jgi:hypothetical protein
MMAYLNEPTIAQGEIELFAVSNDHFDGMEFDAVEVQNGAYVLAHSESGHHHVLDCEVAEVSRVKNDSQGMNVLRLIVTDPEATIVNLNPNGHKNLPIPPRLYEARISREMGMDDVVRDSRD